MGWDSTDIEGNLYEYGFAGWDGENPSTCTFSKKLPLDQLEHNTAFNIAGAGGARQAGLVCSNVVRVRNSAVS